MRIAAIVLVCLGAVLPAQADEMAPLYTASAIVTGRDNLKERERGTREALLAVLAKVSADAAVAREAAPRLGDVERYVRLRRYTDRKAGIQISDEQGTRDRSFILEIAFDPARIDALLRSLGREPWKDERPPLLVRLEVTDSVATYEVTQDSERGWGQREAIMATAAKAGLPVLLPPAAAPAAVLSGSMKMTAEGYWNTSWRLRIGGAEERWTVPATTFDRAIESGIWTAARRLASRR